MKFFKVLLVMSMLLMSNVYLTAQNIHDLLTKIKQEYKIKNYYTALNYCREIIKLCNSDPVSECYFTNVMKAVYRYKGFSEFEIYKKEQKQQRLVNAIYSLQTSYDLFRDAEILYMVGYLTSVNSLLKKNTTNLTGLVKAWVGILELYGHNDWNVNHDLLNKLKDYVKIADKFARPIPSKHYSGKFAQFMIVMACNLAEKTQLSVKDKKYFINYKKKYQETKIKNFSGRLTE